MRKVYTMSKSTLKTSVKIRVFIILFVIAALYYMFPRGEALESEVNVGSIWIQEDLIASTSFPIIKDQATYDRELKEATKSVYRIFLKLDELEEISIDSLKEYNAYVMEILDSSLRSEEGDLENPTFLTSDQFAILKALRLRGKQSLSNTQNTLTFLFTSSEKVLTEIYQRDVISLSKNALEKDSIAIRSGNVDQITPINKLYDLSDASNHIKEYFNRTQISTETRDLITEYILHFVFPNIIYNEEFTQEEIELAKNKVSKTIDIVNEDERIVAKHDRITPEIKMKIDSYKAAKGEVLSWDEMLLQAIGKILHIFGLLFLLGIYFYYFRKKIWHDNTKLLIFAILIIVISYITYIVNQLSVSNSIQLIVLVPAASMMLTIMFDSRVGFYSTIVLALLCGALRGNDYTFSVAHLVAGSLAVYSVRDIKDRTQIFHSLVYILVGYVSMILAFGFERFAEWQSMLIDSAFAATNALISPVLTYGLLVFFERFFNITTDLTLQELANTDRPLLRELARNAPGTFSHSVTMGTLAQSAAEAIGANSLLARVGAYYHDIGKTLAPEYFVENQNSNKNRHDDLTPEESMEVIQNHVRKGIELAKKYKLPQEIIDFIPTHHGTTVLSFFYNKAKELYGEDKVDINDFRYPGPKPFTKETAILMLADVCESAVRSINDPDSEKIENLISNLIKTKIEDGQLDDTPITFKDITTIKKTFVNILVGQQHRRIRYPNQEELEKEDSDKVQE